MRPETPTTVITGGQGADPGPDDPPLVGEEG